MLSELYCLVSKVNFTFVTDEMALRPEDRREVREMAMNYRGKSALQFVALSLWMFLLSPLVMEEILLSKLLTTVCRKERDDVEKL